jgi:copper chaperone CopZ
MEIKVVIRKVYGVDKVYPVCDKAKLFCEIANTGTLTKTMIDAIKKLGYKVIAINPQPETTEL